MAQPPKWLREAITEIQTDIASMKIDLAHHIRRTQQNEDALAALKTEVRPVLQRHLVADALGRIVAFGVGAAGATVGVLKALGKL